MEARIRPNNLSLVLGLEYPFNCALSKWAQGFMNRSIIHLVLLNQSGISELLDLFPRKDTGTIHFNKPCMWHPTPQTPIPRLSLTFFNTYKYNLQYIQIILIFYQVSAYFHISIPFHCTCLVSQGSHYWTGIWKFSSRALENSLKILFFPPTPGKLLEFYRHIRWM